MKIKSTFFPVIIMASLLATELYPIKENFDLAVNAFLISYSSFFKIAGYDTLNKIKNNQHITRTFPVIGTLKIDVNEALVEGLAHYLRPYLFFNAAGAQQDVEKRNLTMKDFAFMVARIVIEQLIIAKRLDKRIALSLVDYKQNPIWYHFLQSNSKILIQMVTVVSLSYAHHYFLPPVFSKNPQNFCCILPGFPCTIFTDLFGNIQ